MALTVPSTGDPVHFSLQQDIVTLTAQITANAGNGKLVYDLTKLKTQKQYTLVASLLATGNLSPASVLTNETYVKAQPGGDLG